MLALTVSSISTIVQMGFVIGVGLLLDTFVVRTVTVPAACVLIGDKNWWPSKGPRVAPKPPNAKRIPAPVACTGALHDDEEGWVDCEFANAAQAASRVSNAWGR